MQFLMGILTGAVGILLASPITVVALVLIKMLYIEEVFEEPVESLDKS